MTGGPPRSCRWRPSPSFRCSAPSGRRHAAVPALDFDVHVSEPSGRQVYAIALSAQVMIEPARRAYDAETRAKLVELFGAPERWATTTRSLVWHQADALVPAFTGATTFRIAVPAGFDMEVASSKYLLRPRGRRGAARVQLQRHDPLPRRRWPAAAVARAVVLLGRVPAAGGHLARPDRPLLPAHGLDPAAGGHARCAPAREGPARLADARRVRVGAVGRRGEGAGSARAGAIDLERAGRHAAVRGLRALPVHAGRDEERHADAVRDRVSARLCPRARERVRPPRAALRRGGRRPRGRVRGALPRAQRRAPPGGAAAGRRARRLPLRRAGRARRAHAGGPATRSAYGSRTAPRRPRASIGPGRCDCR